uniref:CCD97-like C-terminal domain-containing protein n=1 Tax=Cuerna arida TaxID=1464854 RepID=A0A1B6EWJ6_9HEMI
MTMECSDESNEYSESRENERNADKNQEKAVTPVEYQEELADVLVKTEHKCQDSGEKLLIRKAMLEHLSTNSNVFFRQLKDDEEELSRQQKSDMAEELLDRSYGLFLAKYGNHLLKEHLCYFETKSEEDAFIIEMYLKQLNKVLEKQSKSQQMKLKSESINEDEMEVVDEPSIVEEPRLKLRKELLDYLSLSKEAHFKSQQVGEPDLSRQEKREIAEGVLARSPGLFLSRFGTHLLEKHLDYFDHESNKDDYEITYHLKHLRKTHCKTVTEVGIKNRRFEALKKMVEEGSYFCETEMRNRNPLLYEQLVGRFLTAEERRERLNNIDTTNITFVNLLLEQMDREAVKKLRKEQEDAEDDVMEEEDDSDEEMEDGEFDSEEDNDLDKTLWGEGYTDGDASTSKKMPVKREEKKVQEKPIEEVPELSDAEKHLLMEEFRSNMFSSFLEGKDADFDYSQVDYNSDYDDLEVQGQDEEEKYFDEESSQDASCDRMSDGDDLLEQYMDNLQPEPTPQQLADKMKILTHCDT